ncbi:hypothetical protein LWI28_021569 [Acer negundo]|uniref:Uncharacterized protein n=1 Tax=Acer negundo TaxID=4023 RepID=A0AAD5IR51_ACENE|nr:hypothetical protein LWI28_021569 [Acer negundo]
MDNKFTSSEYLEVHHFEGAKLNRYLKIYVAYPVSSIPLLLFFSRSRRTRTSSPSPSDSYILSPSTSVNTGTAASGPSDPALFPATPPLVLTGLTLHPPISLHALMPSCPSIKATSSWVSLDAMVTMPGDLIVTRGTSMLAKEADIATQTELVEARSDLARSKEAVDILIRFAAESKRDRQEAIVDLERMKCALDTETIKFARHRAQREELAREKAMLMEENQLLWDVVPALKA